MSSTTTLQPPELKFGDFVRSPTGTTIWIESNAKERHSVERQIHAYASNAKAKVSISSINGFDRKNAPYYLIKAEVITQGDPRQRTGPKVSEKNNQAEVG